MKKLGYIKNKDSLIAKLRKDMKPVMKDTGDIMMEDLQEQIKKDVYMNDYFPNIQYYGGDYSEYGEQPEAYPTFEFLYAWDLGINKKGDSPSIEIKFDSKVLSKKPHRSLTNPSFDPRKYLAEILNVDGVTSGLQVGFKGKHSWTGEMIDTSNTSLFLTYLVQSTYC